jgi:TatD DNase family protein
MSTLVDSHVHLDRYPPETVRQMLNEAGAAGVRRLLTIGTDLASSRAALMLAETHPEVLAAVGIHPTRLHTLTGDTPPEEQLRALLTGPAGPRPDAIGEVGLDAGAPDLAGQGRFLRFCAALAARHDLPLVLHVVGEPAVHLDALVILADFPSLRAVAHYFVGGPDLAEHYLAAGCWISVGRPVTRPSETAVRAAVPLVPPARLLLETDTYPLPGRATVPRDVTTVCAAVAELTGRGYAEVAAATTASFAAFMGASYSS